MDYVTWPLIASVASFISGLFCCYKLMRVDSEVLFFPDDKMPCNIFLKQLGDQRFQCRKLDCKFAHDRPGERTSLIKMLLALNKAEKWIDLCVYDFSQWTLGDFLINAKKRGVQVRVITDPHFERQARNRNPPAANGQNGENGAGGDNRFGRSDQIPRLQEEKIKIKASNVASKEAPIMHNKFVLIDRKYVLTGSFNWTHAAVTKNDESVIMTNERRIVREFTKKFDDLWNQLADCPRRYNNQQC